ncbi:Glycosyltransferase [Olavius algarvensis associated proteobacterium Delta 3]|nr:Glycosyltransferase [Olavius algarvensis associated proteobacterium Delta 3]
MGWRLTVELLAISNHATVLGGGEHSFLELVSTLPDPWRPVAATPGPGGLAHLLRRRGIRTIFLPMPPIRPQRMPGALSGLFRFLRVLSKSSIRLIYANGSRAALYGGIAANLLRTPMVWHCRIVDRDPRLDPVLQHLSTRIIVNSHATARRFPTSLHHKVRMIYNGIDIERFSRADIERPDRISAAWKNLLVVARASRWKRHDLALAAFGVLAQEFPELHLVCVGGKDPHDIEWWQTLQERTRRSAASDRIHWVGPEPDVRPWYASAFLLALPSTNEPFGRVVVEAMASGVPVIASRGGGVPEIITHNVDGLLFREGDLSGLIDGMRVLITDSDTRNRLVLAGKNRSCDFGLEQHTRLVSAVFREALSGDAESNA